MEIKEIILSIVIALGIVIVAIAEGRRSRPRKIKLRTTTKVVLPKGYKLAKKKKGKKSKEVVDNFRTE